jgi:hypothetical protein
VKSFHTSHRRSEPDARTSQVHPSYLLHQQSGRGRAIWTDPLGVRRYKLLPGAYDSPESRTAFGRLLLELEAAPHHVHVDGPDGITMAEMLVAFLEHAERHYRGPDGNPRPTDPPFLFVMLLAARKAGDRMLESLARDWLAEIGIRVVFADTLDSLAGKGVSHVG